MSKRKKFVLTSVVLSLGFVGIQFLEERFRFLGIGGLGLLTLIAFYWSIYEGLGFNLTLMTLILPTFFTVGVGLFWFLLPANIYARIPVVAIYGIGVYSLCLTMNIYTVAAIRNIALLRAARGVGFVLTLFTLFLLYDAMLSLRVNIVVTSISVFLISLPVFLQAFWSIPLEGKADKELISITFFASLLVGEIASIIFFWPVTVVVGSLFLTSAAYVLLGLGQAKLDKRLFGQTIKEYLTVGALVFLGMFFATKWGG